jgi:hypothetical protein
MLSRKICRPKVVVRSLFWMICKDSRIAQPLTALAGKRLLPDRHEPYHARGLEIGQDLTPMCSGCSGERPNGEGVVPDGVGKALSLAQRLRGGVFRS